MNFEDLLAMLQMAQQMPMFNQSMMEQSPNDLPFMLAQAQIQPIPRISEEQFYEIINRPKNYMTTPEESQRYAPATPKRLTPEEEQYFKSIGKNEIMPQKPYYIPENDLFEMLFFPKRNNTVPPEEMNRYLRRL